MSHILDKFDKSDLATIAAALHELSTFVSLNDDDNQCLLVVGNGLVLEFDHEWGICDVLDENSHELVPNTDHRAFSAPPLLYRLVSTCSVDWPHHSGVEAYPVAPENSSAEDVFDNCKNNWATGEYGDLRRDLCKFLAEHVADYLYGRGVK